ncbi:MAG: DUF5050 domain-containing protein [Lewinella sp.]|nr:DUF5050 domain-containing protein [Lewinella sp.]MCB9304049.1 DUF5050 domain-containing protein [Lewinellaceae bacterium]
MKNLCFTLAALCSLHFLSAQSRIYWADPAFKTVRSANLNGSGIADLCPRLSVVSALAIDTGGEHIYWTDHQFDWIVRTNYEGSGHEVIVTVVNESDGMAFDPLGQKLYWTEGGIFNEPPFIRRCNPDGSGIETIVSAGLDRPRAIAVDGAGGKIYWVDLDLAVIKRANLDGSSPETLHSGLSGPNGLGLANGKIYWTETSAGRVRRSNLDGSGLETLITNTNYVLGDIKADPIGGKMYFADTWNDRIYRANLNGGGVETFASSGFSRPISIVLDPAQDFLFFASGSGAIHPQIRRMTTSGGGLAIIAEELRFPAGVALDAAQNQVYFTDSFRNKVYRVNSDGTEKAVITSGLSGASGIALDLANGHIYWTEENNSSAGRIGRANLDGTNKITLLSGLNDPEQLALDLLNGKIYWTDSGNNKVQRANLDGSNAETLLTSEIDCAHGIALDPANGKLYFTECDQGKILRANLDGSGLEELVTGLGEPLGIALDLTAGKVYWSEGGPNRIQRANLDGSGLEAMITSGMNNPQAIALGLCQLSGSQAAEICEGESFQWGNNTYTEPGQYSQSFALPDGCDSIATLTLNVLPAASDFIFAQACAGESFNLNGVVYNTAGIYQQSLQATNGCDSLLWLALDVLPLPVVSLGANTTILLSDTLAFDLGSAYASVLWSNGSTNPAFVFIASDFGPGVHEVVVTVTDEEGCSSTNSVFITVEIENSASSQKVERTAWSAFPNPLKTGDPIILRYRVDESLVKTEIWVFDSQLREVGRQAVPVAEGEVSLPVNLAPGMYFLAISSNGGSTDWLKLAIVD